MASYKLYFSPGTCARATLIALEEIGAPFETVLLKFRAGEHKQPPYLQHNPKGKVPTLVVDGQALTENVAILTYLNRVHPEARLLPVTGDAFKDARALSDLAWCASTIHPIFTRVRLPFLFCDLPPGIPRVQALAEIALADQFRLLDERLSQQPWTVGKEWSVVDGYVFWLWEQAGTTSFDRTPFKHLAAHETRMLQRPAVQRAMKRELEADAWLDANGFSVKFPPGPPPPR